MTPVVTFAWERTLIPGRGTAIAAASLCLAVTVAGCTVKSPEVPRLDFTASISVANDTTTIQEVAANRSEYLQITDDGRMTLDFSTAFNERVEVGERLQVTPTSNSFATEIGVITLPGQDLPAVVISMADLLGTEIPESGEVPVIPGSSFDTGVEFPLVGITGLEIAEGGIDVEVTNGLPIGLSDLTLALVDEGNGSTIDTIPLGAIAARGGSGSGTFDLTGKRISSDLSIQVSGGTEEGTDVDVSGDPSLVIDAALRDMTVTEATAVIPQQVFTDSQVLEFPDDRIQVRRASISKGGLVFNVRNDIPLLMEVQLTLDDLKKPDGETNTFVIDELTPGEVRTVTFDLTGNEFAPEDPLRMRVSYSAQTFPSDREVTIRSDGVIEIEAVTDSLVFSRVEGTLNNLQLPFDPASESRDFPTGLNQVALGSTEMAVFVTSAVGFLAEMALAIQGTNKQGETGVLVVEEVFERGNPDNPVSIEIGPDPEELTNFLNLLPSEITVDPTVKLGDGVGTEIIEPSHWVRLDSVVFRAPARFRILGSTSIEPDPIRREFSDDEYRGRIRSNLRSAKVTTNIENHIPLGVRVSVQVARTAEDVYANPILTIPTDGTGFGVEAAPVDSEGRATGSTASSKEVELSAEDILVFLEDGGVYTGVLVEIDATNGNVELFGTDFVTVEAGAQIVIELNEDLVK